VKDLPCWNLAQCPALHGSSAGPIGMLFRFRRCICRVQDVRVKSVGTALATSLLMDTIQSQNGPLALEPVDVPTADRLAARELRMTTVDRFLASAAKEYEEGHVDPTLWTRAAQSGNDESLVIAGYLRARATALQLQKRDRRLARQANKAQSTQNARNRKVEPEPRSEIRSPVTVGVQLRGVQLKAKYVVAAAAALASVVAATWLIASPQESESIGPLSVSAAAPSAKGSAPANPSRGAQVVGSTSIGTSEGDSVPTPEATVQQLKDAGNWNVLVLYASKWTRDEPNNAAAWKELSIGYTNLRQFDDALVAATRAVELSPGEALLWRNLGHLNMTLERLPEAGSAFDRALAVSSDDADALCGAALVAHRLGRTKDADAIARRVKSNDGSCPDMSEGESVAVVVRSVVATKPASSVRR
jgi:tetratricopeptide (TPR) repeat protein